MKNPKLSNRYAKALYEFSLENDNLEAVYQDIVFIKSVFHDNRNLFVVIESPVIFPDKKTKIFSEIFEDKTSKITFGFLKLLIMKKREPALLQICDEFIKFYYIHHNIKIAWITTAQELEESLVLKIKNILEEQTHATIEIQLKIDPAIVGGFIIKIDDFVIDASILSKINQLKREFSYNIYQPEY
jgi:F-type H+-transporting ATPase subunit delta